MRNAIIVTTTLLALTLTAAAGAQPKAKPVVCANYTTLQTPTGKALVCLDGKRPSVWGGAWAEVTFGGARYAVGFRSAR